MRRPIPGNAPLNKAKNVQEIQPSAGQNQTQEYAEKLKLARHLHDQGINPERWTEAPKAPWAAQKQFQETGEKPDDQHFEFGDRLYKTTPAVAATQAQGQDALDVYLGAQPKPVEQMVDLAKVQLKYPFGQPHTPRADAAAAHALNLHYAKFGIDPAKAQYGDPLPMETQTKLQQATKAADGGDIPLGIPGIYRGYDDGFFYAANDGTVESTETQALRRKLAEEKATAQGDAGPMVANDNDPEIDEAVAQSYGEKKPAAPSSKSAADAGTPIPQPAAIENRLPQLISAIEKSQKNEALSAEESDLLARVDAAFAKAGVPIDLKNVDVESLKRAAAASVDEDAATGAIGTSGAATAKRPRTPLEAEVERVYGMSPDVPRPTLLPDPRGADGALTSDVSQWTAPSILYDLVRAFVAASVAADGHPISDEEALNLALTTMGGGRAMAQKAPEILASRRVNLYDGPVTERPFEKDYPNGYRSDAAGNLTHDIDGNPLEVGGRIVGRSVVGGGDEALPAAEFNAIAKEGTGYPAKIVPPSTLRGSGTVGQVVVNRYTRLPEEVDLSNKLNPADVPGVYGHEIGHVIDQLAGEIPVEGLTHELKALYNVGNNPNRVHGNHDMPANRGPRYRPEDAGYKAKDIPREYMAEAIRIYMANPSYLKEVAPKTAAAIRKAVNADPAIRKIIQFNMGGTPLPSLPSPAPDFDPENPPPGYVYGKNFI